MKTFAFVLCCLVPSLAAADNHLMDNDQSVTYDCSGKDKTANIMGNHNVVTLKGECTTVSISGNENKILVAKATTLNVSGNQNTLDVISAKTVNLSGNKNELTWKKTSAKDSGPKVNNSGEDNKITATPPEPTAPKK